MRKVTRLFSAILAVTIIASLLTACGSKKVSVSDGQIKEQAKWNVKAEIPATEYDLVIDGASDYFILLPENPTNKELFAANELQLFFKEATDVELPIQKENEADLSGRYLSVGDTNISKEEGVVPTAEEVKTNGFVLKTIDDDCYIKGNRDMGTRNGVYEWLSYCFDYECYTSECISITETKDLKLPAFDLVENPSFDLRLSLGTAEGNDLTSFRMRFNMNPEVFVTGWACHTTFNIVDPEIYDWQSDQYRDWFSNTLYNHQQRHTELPAQLCFSNTEMREEFIKNLKPLLLSSDAPIMLLGIEDTALCCTCEKCTATYEKYGTNSAVTIIFFNYVAEKITEWYEKEHPDVPMPDLAIFAYGPTLDAPAVYDEESGTYVMVDENVQLHENLTVYLAQFTGVMYPITDPRYDVIDNKYPLNKERLDKWAAVSDKVMIWKYSGYGFSYYLMNNNFEIVQEEYKYMIEKGAQGIYDYIGSLYTDNATAWNLAKTYVMSKLVWDVELNIEELLDDFFSNYFDVAADTMRELFEEERQWSRYQHTALDMSDMYAATVLDAEYWTYPLVKEALEDMEKAYEEILVYKDTQPEYYKTLHDRITIETLQYRYLMIELYGSYYTAQELLDAKYQFRADIERFGSLQWSEPGVLSEIWVKWGIL